MKAGQPAPAMEKLGRVTGAHRMSFDNNDDVVQLAVVSRSRCRVMSA